VRLDTLAFEGDDTDLLPFASRFAGADMVLLGENHHADAEGVAATVRLIRFLHERLGFELLALEADLYGCTKAWEGLKRGDADAAKLCAYREGSLTQAAAPLWRYVARRATAERPLELWGFDCQPSSTGSRRFLIEELAQVIASTPDRLDAETWQRASAAISKLSTYTSRASESERGDDVAALQALSSALERVAPNDVATAKKLSFFRQLARSLLADEAQEWAFQSAEPLGPGYYRSFNERDRQMAENLLWLRARHPGKKIVVWAATAHVVRSLRSIPVIPASEAPRFEPMGKHIATALGDKAIHIGTLHARGSVGMPNDKLLALPQAPAGFLERELARRSLGPRTLVDLRRPDKRLDFLNGPWSARWYLSLRPAPPLLELPHAVVDMILFLEQTRPHAQTIQ
jgi:erythromycin esterase